MKKTLLLLLMTGWLSLVSAQGTFIKTFDSIIGTTILPGPDGFTIGGASSIDIINYWPYPGLLKIDQNGDSLWQKNYPFQIWGTFAVFAKTPDEGSVIAFREKETNNTRVIRTDHTSDTVWTGVLPNFSVSSVITDGDSNYVLSGMYMATSVVIKIDQNGNQLWRDEFRPDDFSYAIDLCNTSDNGYAVVGYKSHVNAPAIGYLMKLSHDGDSLWSTFFDDYEWQVFYDVHQLSDNGFIIAGKADTVGMMSTSTALLIRTDASGVATWNNLYLTVNEQVFKTAEIIGTGGYIVCGSAGDDANSKIVLEKIAPTGIAEWIRVFDIGDRSYGNHAIPLSNSFLLVGESDTGSDSVTVVIRTDAEGLVTGIGDKLISGTPGITVFPNPCFDNISIRSDKMVADGILEIFNMNGKKVRTYIINDHVSELHLNITSLPAGTYSCRITGKDGSGSCVFIKVRN